MIGELRIDEFCVTFDELGKSLVTRTGLGRMITQQEDKKKGRCVLHDNQLFLIEVGMRHISRALEPILDIQILRDPIGTKARERMLVAVGGCSRESESHEPSCVCLSHVHAA